MNFRPLAIPYRTDALFFAFPLAFEAPEEELPELAEVTLPAAVPLPEDAFPDDFEVLEVDAVPAFAFVSPDFKI